jgi:D-alanyl-lipoteichoic acid acyltransferase DltB (MBOAT superfamily)
MLFNSLSFALFLPVVFVLYWFVFRRNLRIQNLFIVVASYIFYGWWDWRFLLLIAFTSLCSWSVGLLMQGVDYKQFTPPHFFRKLFNISNIVLNLGILGVFKYYNFFVDSFISAFASAGINLHASTLNIILPVGVSFYTFQALSYSIDVYKRKIEPTHDVIAFLAFVSFFPQLVAGPIERATNLLPQFLKKRSFEYEKAVDGMRQILWGLFKKILVADQCAEYVNYVFGNYQELSAATLVFGAIFFAFQIYGDFSGYSDIAIGTSRLFGFNLMRNFAFPYFSRDIAEFWRRWHISLTTWFRDYVYIPLGGSRVSRIKIIRNTFVIFLLSGFWHGANWTFILWGAFHAILFLPLILLKRNRKYTDTIAEGRFFPTLKECYQMAVTFALVVAGWIFFRAENIAQAIGYFNGIIDTSLFSVMSVYRLRTMLGLCAIISFTLAVEWLQRKKEHGLEISWMKSHIIKFGIYIALIILISFFAGKAETFIYFQF